MTREQAVVLCRYVRACCPQQKIDDYTPNAWHDLIGDLDFDDCHEAVKTIARRQPFIAPAEIRAEVRRIRDDRLRDADRVLPAADPDARDYSRRFQEHLKALADGKRVGLALMPGAHPVASPTADYVAARAEHAPADSTAQPEAPPSVSTTPWCGQCHDETRTRTQVTADGAGLQRVACPVCGPQTSRSAS
ncbi:hypothetical protein CDO52_00890 [Nocardiopsis gilva YIM 90087]|uniref:Uncharacterized protein n=1 Tax=Nocardiopsis gilva YIM 90087 TaxID=1235441 RepID=A0A223S082_9ACTN|nr:hypothetical protein [Nocardiopsis gilva]ASU81535.1 hypothetical protein CDO52_00890 [Nocardiopsis gilva YIM 90087]